MPSKWIFNIALNGEHYLTASDQFLSMESAIFKAQELAARFPIAEGFRVDLSRWESVGKAIAYLG